MNIQLIYHGEWPQVKISHAFWEMHSDGIARLSKNGVEIEVVEYLTKDSSFIIGGEFKNAPTIQSFYDSKGNVDQLVSEGKGSLPVVCMTPDAAVYLPIKLLPIVPDLK